MTSQKAKQVVRLILLPTVLSVCSFVQAVGQTDEATALSTPNQQITSDVKKALDDKKYANVTQSVSNGIVTLAGTVDLYSTKESADKRAHHIKNVQGVRNNIIVAGPAVDDLTLRDKLAKELVYDRVGYGTTAFNALTIEVRDGVVTLGGVAYGPVDKDSALSLVANYSGVKDLIDNIEVAPVSPMDDRIRIAEARAIYGASRLNRYSLDPAKPIRITVVNGNVTLSGVVDNQGDKDVAGIQANSVPGVFHVTNNLQVAGQPVEK